MVNRNLRAVRAKLVKPDFYIRNEGTIFLLTPLNSAAREWVNAHLPDDAQTWGDALVIEHRYMAAIADGIHGDGLTTKEQS
jgi:hypothetical protein